MTFTLTRHKAETVTDIVYWGAGAFFFLTFLLPPIVIMVIGLIMGTVPSEADGGVLGFGPEYPAFNPQSWLLWVPAVAMAFLSIWTIPLPLSSFPGASRTSLISSTFFMCFLGMILSTAFVGAPGIEGESIVAALVLGGAGLLFIVRALAGFFRLVPRSWREATPVPRQRKKRKASVA